MTRGSRKSLQLSLLRTPLREIVNPDDPLIRTASNIPWEALEKLFESCYTQGGRPTKAFRLMGALLLLKRMENLSDERLVEHWVHNPYYQAFCGQFYFDWEPPCDASALTLFRKRIGDEGCMRLDAIADACRKAMRPGRKSSKRRNADEGVIQAAAIAAVIKADEEAGGPGLAEVARKREARRLRIQQEAENRKKEKARKATTAKRKGTTPEASDRIDSPKRKRGRPPKKRLPEPMPTKASLQAQEGSPAPIQTEIPSDSKEDMANAPVKASVETAFEKKAPKEKAPAKRASAVPPSAEKAPRKGAGRRKDAEAVPAEQDASEPAGRPEAPQGDVKIRRSSFRKK